jgi:hypothetical protein
MLIGEISKLDWCFVEYFKLFQGEFIMLKNKRTVSILLVALFLLTIPTVALANDVPPDLIYPETYFSCDPGDTITVTNVPNTWYVIFEFFNNGTKIGEETIFSTDFGPVSVEFPYGDLTGSFGVTAEVYRYDDRLKFTFEGTWNVICDEPSGGQGCTPGYWRQEQHFDSWVNYSPSDYYDPTFGVDGSFETLLDAVWARGGGEKALARHAVAALLSASSPDVDYAFTVGEIMAMVQAAYDSGDFEYAKNQFEYQNELGCPLD